MRNDTYAQSLEAIGQARARVSIRQVYTRLAGLPPGPAKAELLALWALQQRLVHQIYDPAPDATVTLDQ